MLLLSISNGLVLTLNSVIMDPMKRGVLNMIESVIDTVFQREPNIPAIQQWIAGNDKTSRHEEASQDMPRGTSSPLVVPPPTSNQGAAANKKAHKLSKNARKKEKRRSLLSEEDETSRSVASNESFLTPRSDESSTRTHPHPEVLDSSNNSGGDNNKVAVDHVYLNGDISYIMNGDEIDQIG